MAATLGGGPDDAVLPDPIRVAVSKLLARSGAAPVCMHGPESVAPTAPMTGKEFTGSAEIRSSVMAQRSPRIATWIWDLVMTTKGPSYALPTDASRSIGSKLRALSEDKNMSVAPGHHLLPHERWFASSTLERQRTHRTPDILLIEKTMVP